MAFKIAETIMKKATEASTKAGVRYMRYHGKKGPTGLPKLLVTMPKARFKSRAKFFVLLLGDGPDDGKIRVKKADNDKAASAVHFHHHIMFRFGHVPAWAEEVFDTEYFSIKEISADEYEINLKENASANVKAA